MKDIVLALVLAFAITALTPNMLIAQNPVDEIIQKANEQRLEKDKLETYIFETQRMGFKIRHSCHHDTVTMRTCRESFERILKDRVLNLFFKALSEKNIYVVIADIFVKIFQNENTIYIPFRLSPEQIREHFQLQ